MLYNDQGVDYVNVGIIFYAGIVVWFGNRMLYKFVYQLV